MKKLFFVLLTLAILAPLAALFWPSNGQISFTGGELKGITTIPGYFPMGEMTMISNATATVVSSSGVYTNMAGTTVLTSGFDGFDMPQNNRLRYTNTTPIMVHIACTMSYSVAAGANQEFRARIYKTGSPLTTSEIHDQLSASSGEESTAIHVATTMNQNDYLELFLTNQSAANNMTITTFNLFALGMK